MNDNRKPLSMRELVNQKFEASPFVIGDGLLGSQAIMIVGGPPKSYKSFLVNTIVQHLTSATPLFSASRATHIYFNIPKPVRVLLLEQEIGGYDLKERLLGMAGQLPDEYGEAMMDNLFIQSCDHNMRLDSIAGRTYLAEMINEVKPQVVIMDPFIEFHDADENSTREMSHMLHNLDWLRERLHFATVIVHHTAKLNDFNSLRSGPDLLRGSSVLQGKADSFLMVQLVKTDPVPELKVQFTLRRGKPIGRMRLMAGLNQEGEANCLFHFHRWEDAARDEELVTTVQ